MGDQKMKVTFIDKLGSDLTVVNAARVSFSKHKTEFDDSDARLIRYLAKHDHFTPFTHPQISLRIQAPIFVARQWWRHIVGVARNEVSRRYVDDEPQMYSPDAWRSRPDGSIKQGSGDDLSKKTQSYIDQQYAAHVSDVLRLYCTMLEEGVAPEQARMVLPQSMETEWIETGSLAYYARVYRQRVDDHAQVEIRRLAQDVGVIVSELYPVSWEALTA
jgi:thymidylate synthase (FAD)